MAADLSWMSDRLDELKSQDLEWSPPVLESASGPHCKVGGKDMIMLSANNYLNLTTHPKVVEAALQATRKYGCLLYTSPSPRDTLLSRMPSSA